MLILVCNAGSTSLKFKLYDFPSEKVLCDARIERIGDPGRGIYSFTDMRTGGTVTENGVDVPGYPQGIALFLRDLTGGGGILASAGEIDAVGFKTVAAKGFLGVHELTQEVLEAMEAYLPVAPVHNSCYLEAIRTFQGVLPGKKMVGVFETHFHRSIPLSARIYGAPYEWYEKDGVFRLGYHGASHGYIARKVREIAGYDPRVISMHLGGSASVCAIRDGKSLDASCGFSLQSGLPHSARVGDLDAYAVIYQLKRGKTLDEITEDLDQKGGLAGISGVSKDMRDIQEAAAAGNGRATLAIDFLCHEIKRFIGSYYVFLGGLDYLVFTAGIGEKSPLVRSKVCDGLSHLGVELDEAKNAAVTEGEISAGGGKVKVMVLPTNEEIGIAREIYALG